MRRKLFLNLVFILAFFSFSFAADFQRATAVHLDHNGKKWAEKTLKKLSLEEKVGQMFMVRLIMPQFVNIRNPEYLKWLDQIDTFKPDLLLLDIQLHYEDGREMCRKIKRMPKYASIPVILYSGHEAQYADIQQYGAEDFVEKRFMKDRILDLITFHLAAKAAS